MSERKDCPWCHAKQVFPSRNHECPACGISDKALLAGEKHGPIPVPLLPSPRGDVTCDLSGGKTVTRPELHALVPRSLMAKLDTLLGNVQNFATGCGYVTIAGEAKEMQAALGGLKSAPREVKLEDVKMPVDKTIIPPQGGSATNRPAAATPNPSPAAFTKAERDELICTKACIVALMHKNVAATDAVGRTLAQLRTQRADVCVRLAERLEPSLLNEVG